MSVPIHTLPTHKLAIFNFFLLLTLGRMTLADDVDLEEHIMGKVRRQPIF